MFLTALALLLPLSGCGVNRLDGSLSEAYDLSFSDLQIRRSEKAVQITYLRSDGNEITLRLTVDLEGIDLKGGGSINLAQEYAPGHPRAAVSRAVDGEPVRQLPAVVQGDLTLDSPPDIGKSISGSFSLRFGEGGDLGSGRTLTGKFAGPVEATDG